MHKCSMNVLKTELCCELSSSTEGCPQVQAKSMEGMLKEGFGGLEQWGDLEE